MAKKTKKSEAAPKSVAKKTGPFSGDEVVALIDEALASCHETRSTISHGRYRGGWRDGLAHLRAKLA